MYYLSYMTRYEVLWEAPSFAEFYRTHQAYVRTIGKRVGVPVTHLDDAVSEVFTRILEIDMLSTYDPQRAPFTQWMAGYVSLRMLGLRDMIRTKQIREVPWGLDLEHLMPAADANWTEPLETLMDLCAAASKHPAIYSVLRAAQKCVRDTGGLNVADLAAEMGTAPTTAHQRLWQLREFACGVAGRPVPRRRPRRPKTPSEPGPGQLKQQGEGAPEHLGRVLVRPVDQT